MTQRGSWWDCPMSPRTLALVGITLCVSLYFWLRWLIGVPECWSTSDTVRSLLTPFYN